MAAKGTWYRSWAAGKMDEASVSGRYDSEHNLP